MSHPTEGRLGNVAGVVVASAEGVAASEARDLLARICEQVIVVTEPAGSPLARVVAGLEAVDVDRAMFVDCARALPSEELVLGLTAWPQSPVVMPESRSPACWLCERDAVLPAARARLASGDTDLGGWLADCEVSVLDTASRKAISADGE